MNVYDFDKTIFRGDSTARFLTDLIRHCPRLWIRLPVFAGIGLLFVLRILPKQRFKERMFRLFFAPVPDLDVRVERFWDREIDRIMPWYPPQRRKNDLVITASPEFLVAPACRRLGLRAPLGSPVDPASGRYAGLNCHGEEKVRRLDEAYPGAVVEGFWSDSRSDTPLARRAERAWLVKGRKVVPWDGTGGKS